VFSMDFFKFIQNFGIINKNEKLKNPGAQCWATLWPTVPAYQFGLAEDMARGAATARGSRVRSRRGHCGRGGALAGGPVVLGRRRGLAGKHGGVSGEAPGKVRWSGAHRSSGAMVRRLAAVARWCFAAALGSGSRR
jgi:hypothetical protein